MIGYSKCGDIMIIVEFTFDEYDDQRYYNLQPYTINGTIKDMYNIHNPTKKYFRLGSKKNKYRLNFLKKNILVFTSLDKLKTHYNIQDEINLNVSGYCKTYYDKNQIQLCEEYYHNNYIKEGLYKLYYENGNIKQEAMYVNGELNGLLTEYKKFGGIYFQIYYKNNNIYKYVNNINY